MNELAADAATIELLKAIAHPARHAILTLLGRGERNVGDIEAETGIGQPGLSQQLSVLRKAGLVSARREAKLVFYALDGEALGAVIAGLEAILPVPTARPVAGAASDGGPHLGGAAVFAKLE